MNADVERHEVHERLKKSTPLFIQKAADMSRQLITICFSSPSFGPMLPNRQRCAQSEYHSTDQRLQKKNLTSLLRLSANEGNGN